MKRLFLSLLTLCLLSTLAASAYKKESLDIIVNGQSRNMVVFTPNTVNKNIPLMIVTHGMNQSPEYQFDGDRRQVLQLGRYGPVCGDLSSQ